MSNSGRQLGARARKRMVVPGGGQAGHGGQERGLGAEGGESGRIRSQDPVTVTLVIHVSPQQLDLPSSPPRVGPCWAGTTGSTLPKQAKSRCAMVAVRGPSMIRPPKPHTVGAHAGAEVCWGGFPPGRWWPRCVVGLVTPTRPPTSDDRVKWFSSKVVCDSCHPPSVSFRAAMPDSMALDAGSEKTNPDNDSFPRAACLLGGLLPAERGGIHGIFQPRTCGIYDDKTRTRKAFHILTGVLSQNKLTV